MNHQRGLSDSKEIPSRRLIPVRTDRSATVSHIQRPTLDKRTKFRMSPPVLPAAFFSWLAGVLAFFCGEADLAMLLVYCRVPGESRGVRD